MDSWGDAVVFGACLTAGISLFVSGRVVLSSSYSSWQKLVQVLIVCLLPLVGAWVVYAFLDEGRGVTRRRSAVIDQLSDNPPGVGLG